MSVLGKRREKKSKEEAAKQLTEDREACWSELQPILLKYNLIVRGRLQRFDDGIVAQAILDRKPVPAESATPETAPVEDTKEEKK